MANRYFEDSSYEVGFGHSRDYPTYNWPKEKFVPTWVSHLVGWLIFFGTLWLCHDIVICRKRTEAEVMSDWKRVCALHSDFKLPEKPQYEVSGPELLKFSGTVIDPIISKYNRDDVTVEDYYEMMSEVYEACERHYMPISTGGTGHYGDWHVIQMKALRNGSRVYHDVNDAIDAYNVKTSRSQERVSKQYDAVTSVSFVEFQWKGFFLWLAKAYLRGILLALLVYLIRLAAYKETNLRDELLITPGRFLRMLALWPVGLFIYPYHTKAAKKAKFSLLEMEYLRDKPWNYQLNTEERARLEEAANLPFVDFKKAMEWIRQEQVGRYRRSLAAVCLGILWVSLIGTFRVSAAAPVTYDPICQICSIDSHASELNAGTIQSIFLAPADAIMAEFIFEIWCSLVAVLQMEDEEALDGHRRLFEHVPEFSFVLSGMGGMKLISA